MPRHFGISAFRHFGISAFRHFGISALGLIVGLMQLGCGGPEDKSTAEVGAVAVAQQAIGEAEAVAINMALPIGVPPAQIALAANGSVRLNDRAVLVPYNSLAPVIWSSFSSVGASRLGVDSVAGHVLVNTSLSLADRSVALGSVYYSQIFERGNNVNIFGAVEQVAPFAMEPVTLAAFTVPPGAALEVPDVQTDRSLSPGKYKNITIRGGAVLTIGHEALAGGEYYVENLTIESGGTLRVNTSSGNVRMYLSGSQIIVNGKVLETIGSQDISTIPTRFLLVSQSMTEVFANDVFHGVILATKAKISVTGYKGTALTHRGAFFGDEVEIHQGARIITGFNPGLLWRAEVPPEASGIPKNIERYVPNVGFIDGTNCDKWPRALTPADYVSTLASVLGSDPRAADALWLNQQFLDQNITKISAIGSSRSLLVTSYTEASAADGQPSRRWVALDTEAGTAYDLSYQRLCTAEDMLKTDSTGAPLCSKRWRTILLPSSSTPVKFEVLGLSKQRERATAAGIDCASLNADGSGTPAIQVPTVLLVAPKVQFQPPGTIQPPNRVDLNVNLIVAADNVTGGTPEGTTAPTGLTTIEVTPYVNPIATKDNWRTELQTPPRRGLAAIFAGKVSGIKSLVANDGVRISRIAFIDGLSPYNSSWSFSQDSIEAPTVWRYGIPQSFELLLPKTAAFTWASGISERATSSSPTRMPSQWCSNQPQPYVGPPSASELCAATYPKIQMTGATDVYGDASYHFSLERFGARRAYSPGGAALLSADSGAAQVTVSAPAASPITADQGMFPTGSAVPKSGSNYLYGFYYGTVGWKILRSEEPGKNTFRTKLPSGAWKYRLLDPGLPYCETTVSTHPAGPFNSYWSVDKLRCNSITGATFFMDSGETLRASGTSEDLVGREMTSFIDEALARFWAMPGATPPAEVTKKSDGTGAAYAGAQIISNGLFFNNLNSAVDTATLKQAKPVADYTHLRDVMVAVDPNSTGQLQIPFGQQLKIQRIAETLKADYVGIPLNALGLPYGQFAAPWYSAWINPADPITGTPASKVTYLTLSEVEKRWAGISAQQQKLVDIADAQNANDALEQLLSTTNQLADSLIVHGESLAQLADDSTVSHAKAIASLGATLDSLTANFGAFQSSFGTAAGCPGCDWAAITSTVNSTVSAVQAECQEANAPDPWAVIHTITKVMPVVGAAAGALSTVSGQIKGATEKNGILYAMQYIQKGASVNTDYWKPLVDKFKLVEVAKYTKIIKDIAGGIEEAAKLAETVGKEIDPIQAECQVGDAAYGATRALLMGLANAQATLNVMSIQAKTISGTMSSVEATLANLVGERQTNLELASSMESIKSNTSFVKEKIVDDLKIRGEFVEAACKTVRNGVLQGSKDLYGVSSMLQTSAGRASLRPDLMTPAEDASPTSLGSDKSYPYVTNVWDTEGFANAFDSKGGDGRTSYIEAAQARFSSMLVNNMCRLDRGTDSRPPTGFVVRRVLSGAALDSFFANGYVDFDLGLEELREGGEKAIDRGVVGVTALRGVTTWDVPLTAPVVLGTRYSTCNGALPTSTDPSLDPCCDTCKTTVNLGTTDLGLVRFGDARVPSSCGTGEVPSQTTLVAHGVSSPTWAYSAVVRTCLRSVTTPIVNQATGWLNTTIETPYTSEQWKVATENVCGTYSGITMLVGLRGTPLMGGWTLAKSALTEALVNRWTLGSAAAVAPSPLTKPSGVSAIEVLFFVAAEPKPQAAPANYVTLDPSTVMNGGGA